jgi:hypothetical protein
MVNSGRTSAAEAALLLGPMIAGLLVESGQAATACRDSLLVLRKASSASWSRTPLHRKLFTLLQQLWPTFLAIVLVGPLGLLLIERSLLPYQAGERIRAAALARF